MRRWLFDGLVAGEVFLREETSVGAHVVADQTSGFYILFDIVGMGTPENPTPNIVWDGYVADGVDDPNVCLGEDYDGSYIDLTSGMCGDVENEPQFAACVVEFNTTSTEGRLCSPSSN